MQPRITFVGFGNLGHAIASGAIHAGLAAPSEIGVLEPSSERCDEATAMGLRIATPEMARECETLVLAVKPQVFPEAARAIGPIVAAGPLVLSVMAGVRTTTIRNTLGASARVVRVMPNTPAAVQRGITAIASDAQVDETAFAVAEQLFGSVGRTLRVPESLFDAVTAVSGSGPAFYFRMLEASTRAARQLGLADDAAALLARETLIGAAALLAGSSDTPETLRARVTSKGGTTAAGLARMADATPREGGIDALMSEVLRAARDRGVELGRV